MQHWRRRRGVLKRKRQQCSPFPEETTWMSQYYGTTFGRLHCMVLWCIQCVQPRVISTFLGCWVWAAHSLSLDKQQMWETRHCLKGKWKSVPGSGCSGRLRLLQFAQKNYALVFIMLPEKLHSFDVLIKLSFVNAVQHFQEIKSISHWATLAAFSKMKLDWQPYQ